MKHQMTFLALTVWMASLPAPRDLKAAATIEDLIFQIDVGEDVVDEECSPAGDEEPAAAAENELSGLGLAQVGPPPFLPLRPKPRPNPRLTNCYEQAERYECHIRNGITKEYNECMRRACPNNGTTRCTSQHPQPFIVTGYNQFFRNCMNGCVQDKQDPCNRIPQKSFPAVCR